MEREDNLGRAFDVAVDILSEKVNYFYVFPKLFLCLARENDSDLFFDLIYDKLDQQREDVNYLKRIDKLLEIYLDEVDELRKKSDVLAKQVDAKDYLEFFQNLMDYNNFISLRKHPIEEINRLDKEVKEEKFSLEQAIESLGIKVQDK